MPVEDAETYAKSINARLFETSAKAGTGIRELFAHVAQMLIENSKKIINLRFLRLRSLDLYFTCLVKAL